MVRIGPLLGRPTPDEVQRVDDLRPVDVLKADDLAFVDFERIALEGLTDLLAYQSQLAAIAGSLRLLVILRITLVDLLLGFFASVKEF